jgi:hypothetical protein
MYCMSDTGSQTLTVYHHHLIQSLVQLTFSQYILIRLTFSSFISRRCNRCIYCEISSSHGGEYDVQSCLLGCTAV